MASSTTRAVAEIRLDRDGRLLSADHRILELNSNAGGHVGQLLALPQVATLARLAAKLEIPVSRPALIVDRGHDWQVWVDARADEGGISVQLDRWTPEQHQPPRFEGLPADPRELAAEGEWRWQVDRELTFAALELKTDQPTQLRGDTLIGAPFTRLFALREDAAGGLPILPALAAGVRFQRQPATVRDTGQAVLIEGSPLRDSEGRLLGYSGRACPVPGSTVAPILAGDFAAEIGNALRRPLMSIAATAESITARTHGPLRTDYVDYASSIVTAAQHLLALVDDLADLEAVEQPQAELERSELDLAAIARQASGLLRVKAALRDVRIDPPATDEVLVGRGDFRRTLQILVNLIGNAVRHSPEGAAVWVRLESADGRSIITVADQGGGIPVGDQERIFEKFVRLNPGESSGSGLGLYISRRFARAMGGDLTVDSAPGQGARFALTLPAA
jgi:signal transduction histidine kinase